MLLKDYLLDYLKQNERSLRYVARKTGLSHMTIHRIASGFTNIDIETAKALARFFGVETARIVAMVDPEGHRDFALEGEIATLMMTYPWFRETMQKILNAYKEQKLTLEDLKAAMDYATMKLELKNGNVKE